MILLFKAPWESFPMNCPPGFLVTDSKRKPREERRKRGKVKREREYLKRLNQASSG